MAKINQYSVKGTKMEDLSLPKRFEEKENPALLAQAIHIYRDKQHPGLAKVKTRGEVIRTTRKVYRQKGTGGARHGAKSAPIFVGGGVAHGPKGLKRELSLSDKMKVKALNIALSLAIKEDRAFALDGLAKVTKTAEVAKVLSKVGGKRFLVALAEKNLGVGRYLVNLAGVKVLPFASLNAYEVFVGGTLILDGDIFKKEVKKAAPKAKIKKESK